MFGSIRDKLNTVQEGIAARLQGLSDLPHKAAADVDSTCFNLNAGATILHKFQTDWCEIHQLSENNAYKAQEVDNMICKLDADLNKQWTSVNQMSITLASVPQLLNSVQELVEQLGELEQLCEDVETRLMGLEDMVETQALQERQLDHRFQLAMYKEKKLAGLESLRSGLVIEHSNKMLQHELQQEERLKERQATFNEAFQQDLELFKESGKIPRLGNTSRGTSLEEVVLDTGDMEAFDKFLQEDSTMH